MGRTTSRRLARRHPGSGTWIHVEPGAAPRAHACALPDIFERAGAGHEPTRLLYGVGSRWRCSECGETWVVRGPQYSSDGSRPWFAHLVRESSLSPAERDAIAQLVS